jgi:hypothetical protein
MAMVSGREIRSMRRRAFKIHMSVNGETVKQRAKVCILGVTETDMKVSGANA